jgi:amino acid adenylation domain-containing protein
VLATPFDLAAEAPARWVLLHGPDAAVLGLVIHHLAADAWSLDLLFDELFGVYGALRAGAPVDRAPALSARDHALWQRAHLDRPAVIEADLAYWRERLANLPGRLQLAWDHPPAQATSYRGGRLRRRLDDAAVGALLTLARPSGATPFVALLAVYQALLGRLSRQTDVLVGTPIANRDVAGAEGVVGCLLNTLVLRADLDRDPSFEQLLASTRQDSLAAFDHQRAPFELVLAALDVERALTHTPVIQTMFVLNDTVRARTVPAGLRSTVLDVPPVATQYDVTLMIGRDDGGWHATWDYRRDLFEPATVAGFADCYEALLAQAGRAPQVPLSRLALGAAQPPLPARAAVPEPATLPALFAAQAAAHPDAPAVRDEAAVLSYRELDLASTRMAHALVAAGVRVEDRVAVLLPRTCAAIVAVLAVARAGAAFVCLDPGLPDERLRWIAADAGVRLYVTDRALAARLGLAPEQVLLADAVPAATAALPGAALTPAHSAYVIYTSGSTGTPKGVLLSHRGLAQLQALHRDRFGAGPGAHVLQYAPVTFDASVWDLVMALTTGACLHLAGAQALLPGAALAATLAERGITHLTLPPSNLALLPAEPGTLRTVVLAGEALPAELAQRWRGKVRLWNGYGPTEATVCGTVHDCAGTPPGRAPGIGRALAGTRAYVLDAGLNPLPPGVPGELYLAGQGLARGYVNRPGLTAAAFVPDPFGEVPGERMYRTGDLARWTRDGQLDFLGRIDDQVKLRGIRVEPGEIERVLAGLDARIADAAVVVAGSGGDQYLIGFVTGPAPFDPQPLKAALAARLPGYMVPAWLQFAPRFPLTQNGKLDRKALAAQAVAPHVDAGGAPPRGPLEREIAAIWREVLGTEVGRSVSFFAAGGTSLGLTRLFDRLDARYRGALKLVDLFQLNTVAAIAEALEQCGAAQPAAADFSFRL